MSAETTSNYKPQIILAIDRDFGSGGKAVAELLSRHYQIPLYEKNILELAGIPWNDEVESYYTNDNPRFPGTKTMRGMTKTNEEIFCALEFQFLLEQAAAGNSFVVLGHCAGYILMENPDMLTFFMQASDEFKLQRIMDEHGVDLDEAKKMMKRHNRKRRKYHKQYVPYSWGDAKHYSMCIYTDLAGIEGTYEVVRQFVDESLRQKIQNQCQEENSEQPQL